MKIPELETDEQFEQWLKAEPETASFRPCDSRECPIACFLRQEYQSHDVRVTAFTIKIGTETASREDIPVWVRSYMRRIDNYAYSFLIPKANALATLREIRIKRPDWRDVD